MAEQWNSETPEQREEVSVTQQPGYEHRRSVVENTAAARQNALFRVTQLVWLLFGILEALIALRIILKLIAANPYSVFASLVYSITDLFLWPFSGLVANPAFNGMVLELTSIIAMIVYALIAWVIVRIVWLLFYRTPARSVSTYERRDDDIPH